MRFRVGIIEFPGQAPEGKNQIDHIIDFMAKVKSEGKDAMVYPLFRNKAFDAGACKAIADAKKDLDMGMSVYCGMVSKYLPMSKEESLAGIEMAMKNAKAIGEKYVRGSYGKCDYLSTRYNPNIPLKDHIDALTEGMKAIVPLCEEYDIDFVLENHCDFSGIEIARAVENVGSDRVGVYIDTGNDITVWTDVYAGNRAMLPFAKHGGHIKDVKGRLDPDYESGKDVNGRFPVQMTGCNLGEGIVELEYIMQYLNDHSKPGDEFQLLVECLWMPKSFDTKAYFEKGVQYLREITKKYS